MNINKNCTKKTNVIIKILIKKQEVIESLYKLLFLMWLVIFRTMSPLYGPYIYENAINQRH